METKTNYGISFVLPMYNEAEIIRESLEFISSVAGRLTDDYEIIVVDDASTDESLSIVEGLAKGNERLKLIALERNTRFAGALKKGLYSASKEVIIYTDSDLGIDQEDIKKALSYIGDNDIVHTFSQRQKGETLWRKITSIVYNFVVNYFFKLHLRDINSSFKIIKCNVLENIELISKSPFIDAEILMKARANGYRIVQIPIVFKDPVTGSSVMGRPSMILAVLKDIINLFIAQQCQLVQSL
jgi:glycosyltransferase involved in cell wall biosynthesis